MNMLSSIVASALQSGVTIQSTEVSSSKRFIVAKSGCIENGAFFGTKLSQKPYNYKLDLTNNLDIISTMIRHYTNMGFSLSEAASLAMVDLTGKYSYVVIDQEKNVLIGCSNGDSLYVFQSADGVYYIVNDVESCIALGPGSISMIPEKHVVEISNGEIKLFDPSMNEAVLVMQGFDSEKQAKIGKLRAGINKILALKSAKLLQKIIKA